MKLRFCKRCVFPETKPDLHFDDHGICSACRAAEKKNLAIDWDERKRLFEELLARHRKPKHQPGWDCLVPVSGGKDSTYQTWLMLEYGMNPLCVCFETTQLTEIGQRNLDNLSKLGCDVIHFKKNYPAYRKMVIEGFRRVGDEMWPNHLGIFTIPVHAAVKFKVPLIIWGENPQIEYGAPPGYSEQSILDRRWLEEFGGLLGNRIQDMVGVDGLTEKELTPYFYPPEEELKAAHIHGIFLSYYFFWDARRQLEIVKQHGFAVKEDGPVEGTYNNYENLDEDMHALHDYLKFVKYGFGRTSDHAGIDIRNGRLTRERAIELVYQYDGKYPHHGIEVFRSYSGLTQEEIDRIIDSFTNPLLFEREPSGQFRRDEKKNLIRAYEVGWAPA